MICNGWSYFASLWTYVAPTCTWVGGWVGEWARTGTHLCLHLLVPVVDDLGEAEISQLNDFLAVHEEHVVWLDVAVKHLFLLVQVVHAKAQLQTKSVRRDHTRRR